MELEPCPFCGPLGGEEMHPTLYSNRSVVDGYDTHFSVACHNCGVEISDEYQGDVVKAWNTRPHCDALIAENERLREALTWKPVETCKVVEPGTSALIFLEEGVEITALWVRGKWMSRGEQVSPTHWMPLPPPPAALTGDSDNA